MFPGPLSNQSRDNPQSQPQSEWTRAVQLWRTAIPADGGREPSGAAQASACRVQLVNQVLSAVRKLDRTPSARSGGFNGPLEPPLTSILQGAVDRFNGQMEAAAYRFGAPSVDRLLRLGLSNPDS